jgi:hypothetical protein
VEAEFARVGILDDVEIVERDRDFDDGKRGCFCSHQEVMKTALASGLTTIVIFEDDVCFSNRSHRQSVKSIIDDAIAFVGKNPNTILGLGGFAARRVGEAADKRGIFRAAPFLCTHAYVVSSAVATEIVSWKYEDRHIDHVLVERCAKNMKLTIPTIAFQLGYFDLKEITTTDNRLLYKLLTLSRNIVSSFVVQIAFEFFFRAMGKLAWKATW